MSRTRGRRTRASGSPTTTARNAQGSASATRRRSRPTGAGSPGSSPATPDQLMMRLADRSRKARVVARSSSVGEFRLLAGLEVARPRAQPAPVRLRHPRARGGQRVGLRRHPRLLLLARLGVGRLRDGRPQRRRRRASDLYSVRSRTHRGSGSRATASRSTRCGDRAGSSTTACAREGDAPTYNLFEIQPDGGSLRRITRLRIPSLMSGLVPLELSANGGRLLARVRRPGHRRSAFRVNPATGKTKALDADFENGLVGFDLTADGRTVLGHTGGPDPTARHNVVTIPYAAASRRCWSAGARSPGLGGQRHDRTSRRLAGSSCRGLLSSVAAGEGSAAAARPASALVGAGRVRSRLRVAWRRARRSKVPSQRHAPGAIYHPTLIAQRG